MTLCPFARPDVRGAWHRRPALVALVLACVGLALESHPASAVGLGAITQQSALGQSLRIVVPVTLGEGENIPAECFRIVAADRDADGVPQVQFGRVGVERSAAGTALVVTNARPVNDPIIRLTLQAGCEASMRREYTLFMDPPAIEAPVVAAQPAPSEVAVAPPPAPAAREARRPARPPARTTTRAAPRQAPSAGTGESAGTARKSAPAKGRVAAKPAPSRAPAAADRPRLAVSSGAPGAATEADRERARQEKAAAIEAETQVLRQRIVELTALVERMQEELRAQERAEQAAAEAARSAPAEGAAGAPKEPSAATQAPAAPQEPAKAPAAKAPPAPEGDWWDNNGTLIGVVLVLPFLLAAFLLWRRRRAAEDEQWRAARAPASRGAQTTQGPTSALRNPVAGLVSPRTEAASTITGNEPVEATPADVAADAVAVSELSHATEEAGVFLAFGQTERAIEVLREHIKSLPRSMPAAWLMLLDLYHAAGKRPEFRKLAEDFHVHFNAQSPLWEAFASGDRGAGGIESFPHVQKQVVELWRKPGCRGYLERLLYDNREGRRNGFPLSTYADILLLLQVLDAPENVDIDTDLRESGRLEAAPKPAVPASRARRPVPPDPAASRPAQQPIRFDLDPPSAQGEPKR